jgi:predicted nuclease of predicted toxin-antitoxin system
MKLLLDQGLPRRTAPLLRARGLDTVHLGEIGLSKAEDEAVLETARQQGRILVTLDADFHALMAIQQAHTPSVIRVRREGLRSEAMAELLLDVLNRCGSDLASGVLVTVQEKRLRLRKLPLIR